MKRFYKSVSLGEVEGGYAVLLDGRTVKTPMRAELVVPGKALAEALVAEWDAQEDEIDPHGMPLTRFANTAIDRVWDEPGPVVDEIAGFGASDHLCYRADEPEDLIARQVAAWDPLIDWVEERFGTRPRVTAGIVHVEQPATLLAALREAVAACDPFQLSALHTIVTGTGSLILGLAHMEGRGSIEDIWAASRVDETWQAELWGVDAEATANAESRQALVRAAAHFLELL